MNGKGNCMWSKILVFSFMFQKLSALILKVQEINITMKKFNCRKNVEIQCLEFFPTMSHSHDMLTILLQCHNVTAIVGPMCAMLKRFFAVSATIMFVAFCVFQIMIKTLNK